MDTIICKNCNYYKGGKCHLNIFEITEQEENDWCLEFRRRLADGALDLSNWETIEIGKE